MLLEQLSDTISIDSAYYAQDIPATIPINLVDAGSQPVQMHPSRELIVGNDTLSAQVRVMLDPGFGQSLLDADSAVYASNADWRAWFKGLQVKSESGVGKWRRKVT